MKHIKVKTEYMLSSLLIIEGCNNIKYISSTIALPLIISLLSTLTRWISLELS